MNSGYRSQLCILGSINNKIPIKMSWKRHIQRTIKRRGLVEFKNTMATKANAIPFISSIMGYFPEILCPHSLQRPL